MLRLDLTGKRFGRLTALEFVRLEKKGNRTMWLCKCDCGKKIITDRGNLRHGTSKSCGCLQKELISKRQSGKGNISYKHGMRYEPIYEIFRGAKKRCDLKTDYHYNNYGGRGIKFLWNNLHEFLDDMYDSYLKHIEKFGRKNTSLDRIDNNGNYCKDNCRWATRKEQQNNTRTTRIVEFEGKKYTISELYNKLNPVVSYNTFATRVIKLKWEIKKATNQPVRCIHINNQL